MAITKIAQVTVGAGGAASIDFTSIPSTFTDLQIFLSGRSSSINVGVGVRFNGSTTTYTRRILAGTGSAVTSYSYANEYPGVQSLSGQTASTFGNSVIYIPNYAGSAQKAASVDGVNENNATAADAWLTAYLWATTSAITSISLTSSTDNWVQYSSATLYGISNAGATGATVA